MEPKKKYELSLRIKAKAAELGFDACGIARAEYLEDDAARLNHWLASGFHGEMSYMERSREKRTDPRLLLPGARSVITVLLNYYQEPPPQAGENFKIARYAYGRDYHGVIRDKLHLIMDDIRSLGIGFSGRPFTDSAPVLDKAWAEKAGLGWIGKNTCLINPKLGSFVFIGEIITDLDLVCDTNRINDMCGGCTRCIEACPTGALLEARLLDARKCISYLTIENKGDLPVELRERFNGWIFGCDICQEVCPWNRKAPATREKGFMPPTLLVRMMAENWENLNEETFKEVFGDSAVTRTGYQGLSRNIKFLRD